MYNPYVQDFPILRHLVNGKRLVYLDSAATTQKPEAVIDALCDYYRFSNANPHRGAYDLSVRATELYESSREAVRAFIGAAESREIVFTKNATEALNVLAFGYAMNALNAGDEMLVSILEHHSNLIPWQQVAAAKGATLSYLYSDKNGNISDDEIDRKITPKTKLVSVAHVSNVLGSVQPIEKIIRKAHAVGAVAVIDLAQSIAHQPINVERLDADFAVFSGHKMFGPMGVGVLYAKASLLKDIPPFLFGGDMIEYVTEQSASFASPPQKFEGGTQNVEAVVGLSTAIRYIQSIGFEEIRRIEETLTGYALHRLSENPDVTLIGPGNAKDRAGVISFCLKDVHPHDIASILDADGVSIRAGHHCAQPLMK